MSIFLDWIQFSWYLTSKYLGTNWTLSSHCSQLQKVIYVIFRQASGIGQHITKCSFLFTERLEWLSQTCTSTFFTSVVRETSTNPNGQCQLKNLPPSSSFFYIDCTTESQNCRGTEVGVDIWKSSNPTPLLTTGSSRAGCQGLCSAGFWISQKMETPQHYCVWPSSK